MRTTDFDRIATSAPLNMTAAVVRDGAGEGWTPLRTFGDRWDVCPGLRVVVNAELPQLAGVTFGRLKVFGLIDEPKRYAPSGKARPARWAVRCSCGWFEPRTNRAIRKGQAAGSDDCCQECNYVQHLRVRSSRPPTAQEREATAALLDDLAAKSRSAFAPAHQDSPHG